MCTLYKHLVRYGHPSEIPVDFILSQSLKPLGSSGTNGKTNEGYFKKGVGQK